MQNKVIVKIIGGVGNQMFQYAFGYCLSKRSNAKLYLDNTEFKSYDLRNFELENFNLNLVFANENEINPLKERHLFNRTHFKDKYKFKKSLLKTNKSAYYSGWWQSEKYFYDYKNEIADMFTFKNIDFLENIKLLNDIKNSNSVSLHIRLGDYVNDEATKKKFFVCTKDYYKNALNYIAKNVSNPKFFVFSDDIETAKSYLPECFEYTFSNTKCWQEDMYLMTNAKHNIIPNSSFGWWCAYLNKNPNKLVLAPQRWYAKGDKTPFDDVIPKDWIKININ